MATWKQIAFLDEVATLSDTDPVSIGTTPDEGTGTAASRDDHVHDLGNGCIDAAALFAVDVVDKAALAPDVAGLGITQAAGGELDVNVDDVTVEIDVDTLQVKDLGIDTAHLAADAVETAKILDLNVTTEKLEADAVDSTKLADDAVGSEHIEQLDATLDFGGQEGKDMCLENLATDPATPILGKVYFKTGDLHPYICTAIA